MSARNEFHDHLDVCPHCREHVFDLFSIGAMALKRSVDEPFSKREKEFFRSESFQDLFDEKMKIIVDQNMLLKKKKRRNKNG